MNMLTTSEDTKHLIRCTQIQEEAKSTRQGPLITSPGDANLQDISFLFWILRPFLTLIFLKITSPLVVSVGNIQSFHKYLSGIYPQSWPTEPAGYHSVKNALYNKVLTINIWENNLWTPPELRFLFLLWSCPYFFEEHDPAISEPASSEFQASARWARLLETIWGAWPGLPSEICNFPQLNRDQPLCVYLELWPAKTSLTNLSSSSWVWWVRNPHTHEIEAGGLLQVQDKPELLDETLSKKKKNNKKPHLLLIINLQGFLRKYLSFCVFKKKKTAN